MSYSKLLLPHRCQIIGWILLVAAPIELGVSLLMFNVWRCIDQNYSHYSIAILYFLFFTGTFLIALSKEKEEDEMIQEFRFKAIAITAYICVFLFAVSGLFSAVNALLHFKCNMFVFDMIQLVNFSGPYFFLYIVIFKAFLLISRYKAKRGN